MRAEVIELKHVQTFSGPSIHAPAPVVVVSFKADTLAVAAAVAAGPAVEQLLPHALPADEPGAEPNEHWLADRVVRLALALLTEIRGCLWEARATERDGQILLALAYHEPRLSLMALSLAAQLLGGDGPDHNQQMSQRLDGFWKLCRRVHPDYQAGILMTAARDRGIPVLHYLPGSKFWQYGWGERSRLFSESMSNADGALVRDICKNKASSKAVFRHLGLPTPRDRLVNTLAELNQAIEVVGYPCVIKPLDRGGGKGVTAGIRTPEQLVHAFEAARSFSSNPLLLEEHVDGDDHRLMVVGSRFVAGIRREPSAVIGDGRSTIRALVDQLNVGRSRNMVRSRYMRPIAFDSVLDTHLAGQALTVDAVLPPGRRVTLRSNANLSTGGVCIDVTDQVHPEVRAMALQLAVSCDMGSAGLDYMTTDISAPPWQVGGAFIEMNTTPGLDANIAAGWSAQKVGTLVLGDLPGRIPVTLVVSARPEPACPSHAPGAAVVAGSSILLDGCVLKVASTAPWAAVQGALKNRSVKTLVIHCLLEDILAHGLPLDRVDRVVLRGVAVTAEWQQVFERCSAAVDSLP